MLLAFNSEALAAVVYPTSLCRTTGLDAAMGSVVHDSRAAMDSRHCSCSYAAPHLSSLAASRGRARRGVAPRLRRAGCLPQPQQPLCAEGAASGVIAPLPSLSSGPSVDEAVWDVLGLGQAMVDFAATVNDDTLAELSVEKGCRRVISVDERGAILQALDGSSYQINAGGSLANSIVALARLGAAHGKAMGRPLRVAMAGCIGDDPLGYFFREQMRIAGVSFVTEASPGTATGTVVVLTTPDANRTFLSYLGTPEEIKLREALREAISRSRMMVVEGYLWEMPNALQSIQQAIEVAQEAGTLVALTAGDPSLVERQRENLWAAIDAGADLLFMNASEARALLGQEGITAQEAAQQLSSKCPLVVVTDGSKGSYITGMGHLHVVPPHWSPHAPVDTCGAGDAYAAGILYALLCGFDLTATGKVAARVASKVISRHGAELTDEDAADVAAWMPSTPGEGIGTPPPPPPQQSHVLGTVVL